MIVFQIMTTRATCPTDYQCIQQRNIIALDHQLMAQWPFGYELSQWVTALKNYVFLHWLSRYPEWSLWRHASFITDVHNRETSVLGLYSPSRKTSYRQKSWSIEAARLGVIMIVSHCGKTWLVARDVLHERFSASVVFRAQNRTN